MGREYEHESGGNEESKGERRERERGERAVKDDVRDHCIATADSVEDPEILRLKHGGGASSVYGRCINSTFTRIARSSLATDPETRFISPWRLSPSFSFLLSPATDR